MRLRLFGLLVAAAVFPSSANATRVVVLQPGGHAVVRNDPFVSAAELTPPPAPAWRSAHSSIEHTAKKRAHRRKPRVTIPRTLAAMSAQHRISASSEREYVSAWNHARSVLRRLGGTRATELGAVIQIIYNLAVAKELTPSRLPVLWLTLARNVQYWSSGPLLAWGQRVEFPGSQLVWEYYTGQGIQLQVLGTFGKADGLFTAGPAHYAALRSLLDEMVPLAVQRGGALAWEYYFNFDGGKPPWTSAMSQGTAIAALSRGAESLPPGGLPGSPDYLALAHQALGLFTLGPPTGVSVATPVGARYVQYTFDPGRGDEVINAFLQSLIGLYQYAKASGDQQAAALFAAGNREAQAELPQFDTGAWSLYEPGEEDSLGYHELVTGFLGQLCSYVHAAPYCTTASRFRADLKTPPAVTLLSTRLHTKHPAAISFRLSKVSHVGIVVKSRGHTLLYTSASFPYGVHSFALPVLRHTGTLSVSLSATDLAGNYGQTAGTVSVTR